MASKEVLDKLCETYYLASLPVQKQREVKMTKFGIETHEFFLPADVAFKFTDSLGKPDKQRTQDAQEQSRERTAADILSICWNTLLGERMLAQFQEENPGLPSDPFIALKTPDERMAYAERIMGFLGIGAWAVQQLESIENRDGVAVGMKRMKNE